MEDMDVDVCLTQVEVTDSPDRTPKTEVEVTFFGVFDATAATTRPVNFAPTTGCPLTCA